MEITQEVLKDLIECLGKSGVDKLRLETENFKLSLEKNTAAERQPAQTQTPQVQIANAVQANASESKQKEGHIMVSPLVGTFYSASSPQNSSFAKVGQQVKKGDTLFIVESMKLMNEVASEFDGTVAEIMVKDGQPLEYGQPVMRIE